ncbi:triacylglycerol lipase [Salinisphaera sp. T5B8]|uniref:esterase/lipase family protein n=1 Tax=Salinisphaera sp. T5B8 TaxID=1304154 RepID=UPI00333E8346
MKRSLFGRGQLVLGLVLCFALAAPAHSGWRSFFGHDTGADARGYTETRYPIVLVHGLFGFDGIGPVDYFSGIPEALREGGAEVYVAQVSAANYTEVRGEQLLAQVQEILAASGAEKVNLIGHSHGGPTIRYVAGVAPELVASVTSIAGVNRGSPVADLIVPISNQPVAGTVAAQTADSLSRLIDLLSDGGYPQNSRAALYSLSTEGSADFNRRFPAAVPQDCGEGEPVVDGIRYYSWTGIYPITTVVDPSDSLLAGTSVAFKGKLNDGLVGQCSSKLGDVIRDDYFQNHLDEVNQVAGLVGIGQDVPALYRQQANRLKNAGL